ncbi:MAG: DUF3179 domain-containing protein [Balneolales bacterium]
MEKMIESVNNPAVLDSVRSNDLTGNTTSSGDTVWTFWFVAVLTSVMIGSCDSPGGGIFGGDDTGFSSGDWLIPLNEIFDGGPGKDGIPSIDAPQFVSANAIEYVGDERLVAAVNIGGDVRAYPHQILDWHEIVNDQFEEEAVAFTHCPLTGTAIAWDRKLKGEAIEFGVSGLLFRNNLIAYDRFTDSHWSQMQLRSVKGTFSETDIEIHQVLETTWENWLAWYPDSKVLTTETGFQRNYSGFAYGQFYLTDDTRILFPVSNPDGRLNKKVRVHGIIGEVPADESASVRVYPIDDFAEGVEMIEDRIGDQEYLIVGSSGKNFAAAFRRTLPDGTRLSFVAVQDKLPEILMDDEGNYWDIFGYAVKGPRTGERLTPARSYTGYWFAWADFYPGLEIYKGE